MTKIGWLLVFLSAFMTTIANLLLRDGILKAGGFPGTLAQLIPGMINLAKQPLFDFGVFFYGAAAIVWFRVVSTEKLGLAYPILVSITFILVNIGAVLLFGEGISIKKIFGLAVILGGIWLLAN